MITKALADAKKAELEAELELYREGGIEDVATFGFTSKNSDRVAEIERLRALHGQPVKLDAEFIDSNKELAKILLGQGATEDEIVFAEDADVEQAAALDKEVAHRDEIFKSLEHLGVQITPEVSTLSTDELEAKLKEVSAAAPEVKEEKKGPEGQSKDSVPHDQDGGQPELVYQRKTVIRVENTIANGTSYKDVTVATGETFRISPEEFDAEVKPRE